jgi:hypothetical protein
VGRDPDGRPAREETSGHRGGEVVFSEVNADSRQTRHVHPVVDDDSRAGLPPPPVGLLDRLEELAVGQVPFADLEKADSGAEEAGGSLDDLVCAAGSARADRVDRRNFQRSV